MVTGPKLSTLLVAPAATVVGTESGAANVCAGTSGSAKPKVVGAASVADGSPCFWTVSVKVLLLLEEAAFGESGVVPSYVRDTGTWTSYAAVGCRDEAAPVATKPASNTRPLPGEPNCTGVVSVVVCPGTSGVVDGVPPTPPPLLPEM